eukprot:4068768-Prorocentrum_lima.AAC.1
MAEEPACPGVEPASERPLRVEGPGCLDVPEYGSRCEHRFAGGLLHGWRHRFPCSADVVLPRHGAAF